MTDRYSGALILEIIKYLFLFIFLVIAGKLSSMQNSRWLRCRLNTLRDRLADDAIR
jgi:hypothetical protein